MRGAGDGVVEAVPEFCWRRARTGRTVAEVQVHACARGSLEREAVLAQRLVLLKRFAQIGEIVMSLFTERFNKRPRSRPESLLVAQSYPLRGPLRGYDAPLAKLLLRVEEMQRPRSTLYFLVVRHIKDGGGGF